MPDLGKEWEYIEKPLEHVQDTQGLTDLEDPKTTELEETDEIDQEMSQLRSEEVKAAEPDGVASWSDYSSEK
jgi:Mn-containing catalase